MIAMPHRLLDLSAAFSRFRGTDPDRLHFAAHSHHCWPDLTRDAQTEAWDAAARRIDDKWDEVLGTVWTDVATHIAGHLRPARSGRHWCRRPTPTNWSTGCCPAARPAGRCAW